MAAMDDPISPRVPSSETLWLVCLLFVGGVTGLAALGIVAVAHLPLILALALPLAVMACVVLVWNTWVGLCFAAFAIAPLGIVQVEVASVTVGLPEVLILVLFLKESIVFLRKGETFSARVPWKALAVFLVASLLGVITGLRRHNGAVRVLQDCRQFTEFVVLFLLVAHRVESRRQVTQLLVCFLLGSTLVGLHGILQRFTGMGIPGHQILSDLVHHKGIRSGSFYGSTPLGALMVLAVGAGISVALAAQSRFWRLAVGGCILVCVCAAVFTYTRASWLAMFLVFGFVLIGIRKTPWVVAVSVCCAVLFAAALGPMVAERLAKLSFSKAERSLRERVHYYTAAWHIFREQPVRGLGWGCYFSINDILANERYVSTPRPSETATATVHSAYLQVLVKAGLLGLVSFLAVILAWLRKVGAAYRIGDRQERDFGLFVGITAGLLGYLAHSAFENFFQWPVMAQSFWLMLGLSTVMAARLLAEAPRSPTAAPADAHIEV